MSCCAGLRWSDDRPKRFEKVPEVCKVGLIENNCQYPLIGTTKI